MACRWPEQPGALPWVAAPWPPGHRQTTVAPSRLYSASNHCPTCTYILHFTVKTIKPLQCTVQQALLSMFRESLFFRASSGLRTMQDCRPLKCSHQLCPSAEQRIDCDHQTLALTVQCSSDLTPTSQKNPVQSFSGSSTSKVAVSYGLCKSCVSLDVVGISSAFLVVLDISTLRKSAVLCRLAD